jgi:hypothetical protein
MDGVLMIPENQKGGSILGQGVYGCIFTPPLKCFGSTRKPTPGKLGKLTEKGDVQSEILAAKLFAKRPESKKYMILPELDTFCTRPAPLSEQTEKDIIQCDEPLKRNKFEEMVQFEVPYGGKTLHSITTLQTMTLMVNEFPFYDFMRDMLEIGAYIVIHGFIHNDLHSKNILLNKTYHPRLIDFGRSYTSHSITEEFVYMNLISGYEPALGQIPPELTVIDGIDAKVPLNKILDDIRKEKSTIDNAEKVLGINRYQQTAELSLFLKSTNTFQAGDWTAFMRLYWPVVDSWAIGHGLLSILRKLLGSKQFAESSEWKKRGPLVKNILRGLVKTSPRDRMDCVEALAMYDPMNAVLSSSSGKAWMKHKREQRASLKP